MLPLGEWRLSVWGAGKAREPQGRDVAGGDVEEWPRQGGLCICFSVYFHLLE